ncbi:MAG: hypothetical protein GWO24_08100, partial [Akkermansiaceae bacterium]|nr:hypothetical protein [Akkermansiaceae bacterium]
MVRDELLGALDSGQLTEGQATWSIWALGRIDGAEGDHRELIDIAMGRRRGDLNLRVQATRILGENKRQD